MPKPKQRDVSANVNSSPRHIAMLISDMQDGGAQRVAAMLCNAWVARGDLVSIVTYEAADVQPFFDLSPDVDLVPLNVLENSGNVVQAALSNIKRIVSFRNKIKAIKPDVLLCFGAEVTVIGVPGAAFLNIPVVACERSDPHIYPRGIWKILRDIASRFADHIAVQTQRGADYFHGRSNVNIIPNPIVKPDIGGGSDLMHLNNRFIASMGRLSREKGHDVLIRAFAQIAEKHSDVDLLIIGEGPERSALERLVRDLGLEERVFLPGAAKNPFPVLSKAALFVLPSRFEGFPNALCEAMALGLPCIAMDAAIGAQAVVKDGENGVLVASEDVDAMAQAMAGLLNDRERAKNLGTEAEKIIDTLSLDAVLKQWDAIIS